MKLSFSSKMFLCSRCTILIFSAEVYPFNVFSALEKMRRLTAFAYGTSYFSTVIFIGYVLTLWYKFVIRSNTVGNSFLAVYAEDFMAGFQYKEDADYEPS